MFHIEHVSHSQPYNFDRNNFTSQHLKECICLFNVHCAVCTHLNCQVMCLWSVSICVFFCVCVYSNSFKPMWLLFFFGSLYWKRLHITQKKRRKEKNQRKDILQGIEFIQDATRSESSGKTMEMIWNERRIHTNKKKKRPNTNRGDGEKWKQLGTFPCCSILCILNFKCIFVVIEIYLCSSCRNVCVFFFSCLSIRCRAKMVDDDTII